MGLVQPTVGGDFDVWGNEINQNNTTIDNHTHQVGSGLPITPLGMNINQDLAINGNNVNLIRAIRMNNQSAVLSSAGDITCVYAENGNLYYNNASGVPVQITNGTVVNSNATAAVIFPQSNAASNFTIVSSAQYIELLVNTSGGAYNITMPSAAAVGAGRYFIIKDNTGHAGTNNMTLLPNGSDTIDQGSSVILGYNFDSCFIVSDGSSNWSIVGKPKRTWTAAEKIDITLGSSSLIAADSAATIVSSVSGGIQHQGGALDWITFNASRSRTLVSLIQPINFVDNYDLTNSTATLGAGNAPFTYIYGTNATTGYVAICPFKLHQGATLSSITMNFAVSTDHSHGGVPAYLPVMDVQRVSVSAGTIGVATSLGAGLTPIASPGSGAAWFNSGLMQSFTFTCTQDNVIDQSGYEYYVLLADEHGYDSLNGNQFYNFIISYTNIPNMQFA